MYVVIGDKDISAVKFGEVEEVKRITKELKGILVEIREEDSYEY